MSAVSFDPVWEDLYGGGSAARAPYAFVASFIYRNAPKGVPRDQVRVLEIGCGAGNNLWFAAMEGFSVAGVDGSESAIAAAKARLAEHNLSGDLQAADFTDLPFEDGAFDLVVDRGALTCCGTEAMGKAIGEVRRVLKPGGAFLFNPIADSDTSFRAGTLGEDGLSYDITEGDYVGVGQIRFVSRREINGFLPAADWDYQRIERVEITDMLRPHGKIVASWRVEVRKK
ncbi:MAG: class I SAM-dependent methyltransferase [Rhodospirillales bacterium]|nr:class I SAM-dependent methyltransferase [Rhodospirillales bacterium]MCB9995382.1 class I SAM-dependent methyltransferase [Rhodospirillales bacterium]